MKTLEDPEDKGIWEMVAPAFDIFGPQHYRECWTKMSMMQQ
jgi:hypothetical protein